ncbi:helicase-exonuclease AddAB subunit AddA [Sporolactobacillus shoreae]|uniref:ATP-dependent helicase/nuclease subunit A n=1 Tax=Sporolactobacillus shoreae TaxID=1465501 RepID=A0A4Z0GL75_9BACL|nr:helicase-exonuclease AddAB subunit AddA [Sporolactobacillus shoreae]TGA97130.1 helicase-exonuclease AddAB subunit AddA [Sporolactobacillus shoreae]
MTRAKPEKSKWTEEQWQAITEKGHDLLVAAAAGSGKTAVLVERIIKKVTDQENRITIDDLLVVTFTNAAAAEMRERIGRALDKQIAEHPESLYLRRQQALLSKASIMTLHAFCMSVIKKYYYYLDLDPGFRLLDETEAGLLREEVLDGVLEKNYTTGDPAFFKLVDQYSGDRSDDALRSLIFRVYDFSLSNPWPDQWLNHLPESYQPYEGQSIDDFSWTKGLKRVLFRNLSDAASSLEEAIRLCSEPGGPEAYAETLSSDLSKVNELLLLKESGWESIRSQVLSFTFDKLKSVSSKNVDEGIKDQVKKARDKVKKIITDLKQQWFDRAPEELLQDLRDMAPSISVLVELVREFTRQFRQEKRRKAVLDFSDLEHECLAVLRADGSDPDHVAPSVVAKQYRARFEEVLVDEYQDTNRVQEAVIQLITKESDGGNLFMVGDVKQSIYGFRLAEPRLFIEKYKMFSNPETRAQKIDLSSNFRSRKEVIDGANFLFRQVMDETAGGVTYDRAAELRFGADYQDECLPMDVELIDRADQGNEDADGTDDYESTELEAAAISDRISAMIGNGKNPAFQVLDKDSHQMRSVRYRDIAVLMRSSSNSAAMMKEVLAQHGIPAYAELTKGYFDTIEISVMLAVLKVIDNPFQDIPLASVLRSPFIGLNGDSLSLIRMSDRDASYYEALKKYAETRHDELADKLSDFLGKLSEWRSLSKSRPVSELIWQIYRDTGYFDYAGGLTGGTQRQANLKAFYDRARQYEKTSFRGLFRFLRFIERMRESGGDLGEARALSEQEDVVRIMTIHKSKGLEFPVVFLSGIGRKFNMKDLASPALLHKTLGIGTRWIDPEKRLSVPTLPYLAIREQLRADAVAEEMRILYVAVTRAREKLILVGTVRDAEKQVRQWLPAMSCPEWLLPEYLRTSATSFLDWIGPSVLRHRSSEVLHHLVGGSPDRTAISEDPAALNVSIVAARSLQVGQPERTPKENTRLERVKQWKAVASYSGNQDEVRRRLEWIYPYTQATLTMAKQTVTEIKAHQEYFSQGQDGRLLDRQFSAIGGDRPNFLQRGELSPTERGTSMHILMQHLDLNHVTDAASIRAQGLELVEKEILTVDEENSLDYQAVLKFLSSLVGVRMREAIQVTRECPFSLVLDTADVYPAWGRGNPENSEKVLVQGVIDCIIEDRQGLLLLDYKTDRLSDRFPEKKAAIEELKRRYRVQLGLYRLAIERIWKRRVAQVGLYAFDGGYFVDLTDQKGGFN